MVKVELKGIKETQRQFAGAPANIKKIVSAEIQSAAAEWVAGARRDVPIDQGALKGSISYFMRTDLQAEIVAQKFYAPFMEFGTKGKYKAIPGTEAIAQQFKGYKGGDFQEFLRMITRWAKRKGISGTYSVKTRRRTGNRATQQAQDDAVAWPIALSILKHGIKPHPYFFKQKEIVWPKMIERIKRNFETKSGVSVIMPGDIKRPKIVTI